MRQSKNMLFKIAGWASFFIASGLFLLQMGFLYLHMGLGPGLRQVEYIDHRLFYMINIFCVAFAVLAILLLFKLKKNWKRIGAGAVAAFFILNGVMLAADSKEVNTITSISPDFKHVLSIKENTESGEAIYNRSYYLILGRPKEKLPYETVGEFKVEWLEDDIAAVTYKTEDNSIQQFIGTYGDRGSGRSYYNVGPEIQGIWQGDNIEVISNTEGISVTESNHTELFEWDEIEQFGTLAIVLKRNDAAVWTIGLNKNFEVHADASKPTVGNITIYKATMEKNKPIILQYKAPSQ